MKKNATRNKIIQKQRINANSRYKPLQQFKNKLNGHPVIILGNGPSINDHDLSILNDYFTIGINRIFLANFDPTILFFQDKSLLQTNREDVVKLQAIKVCRDINDPNREFYNFRLRSVAYSFSYQTHELSGRGNSLPLACQLAVALGCSKIILLGIDGNSDGHTHFYGTNQFWTKHTPEFLDKAIDFVKKKCPVPIINCGNTTAWKKQELQKVLEHKYALGREKYTEMLLNNA